MTPFELELLKSAWPFLSTTLTGLALWYLRSVNKSLDSLGASIGALKENINKVEKDITTDLADFKAKSQHRFDRLLGEAESRIGKIEAVCELQHGLQLRRRSSDRPINWAQDSDVAGDPTRNQA